MPSLPLFTIVDLPPRLDLHAALHRVGPQRRRGRGRGRPVPARSACRRVHVGASCAVAPDPPTAPAAEREIWHAFDAMQPAVAETV